MPLYVSDDDAMNSDVIDAPVTSRSIHDSFRPAKKAKTAVDEDSDEDAGAGGAASDDDVAPAPVTHKCVPNSLPTLIYVHCITPCSDSITVSLSMSVLTVRHTPSC
jgi:hypothetical protein